jgi:protein-disulfide isomerase
MTLTRTGLLMRACVALLLVIAALWTFDNAQRLYSSWRRPRTLPAAIVADWRTYSAGGERIGPESANVTVVMFSDYKCHWCALTHDRLAALEAKYPSALALVMRHYPAPSSAPSDAAARAAVCASAQGRFKSINDLLFAEADSIGTKPWVQFALEAGVPDTATFSACLGAPHAAAVVERDVAAGIHLRMPETPGLLVNEEQYDELPWDLERIVARKLKGSANRGSR